MVIINGSVNRVPTSSINQVSTTRAGAPTEVKDKDLSKVTAKNLQQQIAQRFEIALGKDTKLPYSPQHPSVTPTDYQKLKDIIPGYQGNIKVIRVKPKNGADTENVIVASPDVLVHFSKGIPTKEVTVTSPKGKTLMETALTAQRTVSIAEKNLGMDLKWSTGMPQLDVQITDEGAYYARNIEASLGVMPVLLPGGVRVAEKYAKDPDVVSHEVGHAILDSLRDQYYYSKSPETRAIHEALADTQAALVNADNDKVIAKVLDKDGNIKPGNPIENIAEGFDPKKGYLRKLDDTRNPVVKLLTGDKYKYKRYSELKPSAYHDIDYNKIFKEALGDKYKQYVGDEKLTPEKAAQILKKLPKDLSEKANKLIDKEYARLDDQKVYGEEHSYSRVFSSAVYDALKNKYESIKDKDPEGDHKAQFKEAVKDIRKAVYSGMKIAPATDPSFKDMAVSMIAGDKLFNKGKASQALAEAFKEKGILNDKDLKHLDKVINESQKMDIKLPENLRKIDIPQNQQRFLRTLSDKQLKAYSETNPALKDNINKWRELRATAKQLGEKFVEEGNKRGLFKVDPETAKSFQLYEVQRDKDGNTILLFKGKNDKLAEAELSPNMVMVFDKNGKLIYGNVFGLDNVQERVEDAKKFQKDYNL